MNKNMNRWILWLLVALQGGGGGFGLFMVSKQLMTTAQNMESLIIHMSFAVVFLFGIAASVALINKPGLGKVMSLIYQGIQIPIIVTASVAYRMFSGATFFIYGGKGNFGFNFHFGGRYLFGVGGSSPYFYGVNVLAVCLFIYLLKEIIFGTVKVKTSKTVYTAPAETSSPQVSWRTS